MHPVNKPEHQDGSDGVQQDGRADTVIEAAPANSQPHDQLDSLTSPGTRGGGPPSGSIPPTPANSPRKQNRTKFYSVTVGKCCGVFQRW